MSTRTADVIKSIPVLTAQYLCILKLDDCPEDLNRAEFKSNYGKFASEELRRRSVN